MWRTRADSSPSGTQEGSAPPSPLILLVEEPGMDVAGLEASLAPLGQGRLRTATRDQALQVLADGDFACILIDLRGRSTGLATADLLRGHFRDPPLLFLGSTTSAMADLLRGSAPGTVDCLREPLCPDLLRARVGMFLELHRRERALRTALERAGHPEEVGFITDITAQQRAQQERERLATQREEEHARLEAILQQLPAGVYIAEAPSGRLLHCNARAEQILGHSLLEARRLEDYTRYGAIHPDGRPFAPKEHPISRVLGSGEPLLGEELLYRRPDGDVRALHVNTVPIRDARGSLSAVVASFMDITSRKLAEDRQSFLASVSETLASSLDYEATLTHVVQRAVPHLGDGCALDVLEPDGTLRRVAASHVDPAQAELGWELARRYPISLDAPAGPALVIRTGRTELLSGISAELLARYARDAEHLALLRRLRLSSSLVVPLHARGRILGTLTFAYCEASRRHGPEEQLLAEELARRAALAVDNSRLYREAQQAVQLRDEFLSVASHELKTPLTPLQLKLASLARELRRQAGEEQAERLLGHLEVAQRQVRKLSKLVGALLDVSRLSQGKLELELAETDLGEVLGEVATLLTPEATRAGSELRLEAEARVLGRWDRLRLEQILINLLTNAIRYGAGRPIHVHMEEDGERARLRVRDEGIGIPAEAQERIFGKFERAVSERHYGGLGLGLYITQRLVEAMGGRIQVESRPGEGATFTVDLPRAGPPGS